MHDREPDLMAELDAAEMVIRGSCWCGKHPEECGEAGGCAWSRRLAEADSLATAAWQERGEVTRDLRHVLVFLMPEPLAAGGNPGLTGAVERLKAWCGMSRAGTETGAGGPESDADGQTGSGGCSGTPGSPERVSGPGTGGLR